MEHKTTAQIGEAIGIKARAAQRFLNDPEFNEFFKKYLATITHIADRLIVSRLLEQLGAASAVYDKLMHDYLMNKGSAAVAQRVAEDVFTRCNIEVPRPAQSSNLLPAQERALANAARASLPDIPLEENDASDDEPGRGSSAPEDGQADAQEDRAESAGEVTESA